MLAERCITACGLPPKTRRSGDDAHALRARVSRYAGSACSSGTYGMCSDSASAA
jgi:hypothetical protein